MQSQILKTLHKVITYLFSPKQYHEGIELCGAFSNYLPMILTMRMSENVWKGKDIASFSPSSIPEIYYLNRKKIKLFYTQENTHVVNSYWHRWENCYQWKNAPTLSVGFDYVDQPNYIRFPYWFDHLFDPDVSREELAAYVERNNYAKLSDRTKTCAFVCRYDYFGDRAQLADLVEQIMPMSYPSIFRHNDDDMHGKYNDDKIAYLRQFRFNLCPENSNNKGYVTEKIFQAIEAGCVPIYWGNEGYPEPDILNPKAIVYLDKDKPDEGLALLRKLYEDPKAYEEFATQPRFLPGAVERMNLYFAQLEAKLKEILSD